MMLFAKCYNKKKPNAVLMLIAISVFSSFIWMLLSINKTTIILYNLVHYTFMEILLSITEIHLFDYSNKHPFAEEYNTEYFTIREVFINSGRVLGYIQFVKD